MLEALEWLEDNCRESPVTEEVIKHYHRTIRGKDTPDGGQYRRETVAIYGSSVPRPTPEKIPPLMKYLELRFVSDEASLTRSGSVDSTLRLASMVHQKIAFIHPFKDGNGRVARLVMNHVLRRHRAGYSIFPPINESKRHFEVLEEAHRGNLDPLIGFSRAHMHEL